MSLKRSKKHPIKVEIFSKADCHLCDIAKEVLNKVRKKITFDLIQVDITKDGNLYSEYKEQIPVIFINGRKAFKYRIDEEELLKRLHRL